MSASPATSPRSAAPIPSPEVRMDLDGSLGNLKATRIARAREAFEEAHRLTVEINEAQCKPLVELDVGGTVFRTSSSFVQADSGSLLSVLCANPFALEQQADGSVFIDRDPTSFGLILHHLRHGATPVASASLSEPRVRRELRFYNLRPPPPLVFDKRGPAVLVTDGGRCYENPSSRTHAHGQSRQGWDRGVCTLQVRLWTPCPSLVLGFCAEDAVSDDGRLTYHSVVTEQELLLCLEDGTLEYAGRLRHTFSRKMDEPGTILRLAADVDTGAVCLNCNGEDFGAVFRLPPGFPIPLHPMFYNLSPGAAFSLLDD